MCSQQMSDLFKACLTKAKLSRKFNDIKKVRVEDYDNGNPEDACLIIDINGSGYFVTIKEVP